MKYNLPTSQEKSKYVESKFGEIAQKYDLFNDIITFGLHRYWKKFMVKQTGLNKGNKCLDLCCGTGDISHEVSRQYPDCHVIGLDFSMEMLNIAESKNKNNSNINFLHGDALRIPFPDESFHAITIGYGLRNVSSINSCLKEIFRVLKFSGVLVCLDVGKVRLPIISKLNNFYFFRIVPFIGNWLMPGEEMFHYLPHSSLKYPSQESIKNMILEVGFRKVEVQNFLFGASTLHIAHKETKNKP